ncbi:MAG: hypothetical protein NTV33_06645 [Coprothermobacterota bacterium]|nr:hypothetical protein [Coprothermobacterota bacterium]
MESKATILEDRRADRLLRRVRSGLSGELLRRPGGSAVHFGGSTSLYAPRLFSGIQPIGAALSLCKAPPWECPPLDVTIAHRHSKERVRA